MGIDEARALLGIDANADLATAQQAYQSRTGQLVAALNTADADRAGALRYLLAQVTEAWQTMLTGAHGEPTTPAGVATGASGATPAPAPPAAAPTPSMTSAPGVAAAAAATPAPAPAPRQPAVSFVRTPARPSSAEAEHVAVVTDSTAYLPESVIDKYGITVVPLNVHMQSQVSLEGVDLAPSEFATWITAPGRTASTSPPSPETFRAAYESTDARDIVSIHLSARLSGTRQNAVSAAHDLADEGQARIKVVDSRATAMGLGFAVIAAAEAAAAGGDVWDVMSAAETAARRSRVLFYVDTLEYLKRGGRIGAAAAWVGTALDLKPILHIANGVIEPLERVRGANKAIARLEEIAVTQAGSAVVDIAIHHLASEERADDIADHLSRRVPGLRSLHKSEVGAVIGAHTGPGALGIVLHFA
ncbi:MAG: DegV family protein [Mycobacteriales bacterium]|nr:DegV family protein [Frankia sp.]